MTRGMVMKLMTFHFSSTVPGGLLFSQWTVQNVGGEKQHRLASLSQAQLSKKHS